MAGRRAVGPKRAPQYRAAAPDRIQQFVLGTKTTSYRFGKVEIFARPLQGDDELTYSVRTSMRKPDYKHPDRLRRLNTEIAAECATDRTNLLIE